MILTESELRALWQNGHQPLPAFAPGTRFSPAAQDFLKDHGLTVHFALASAPQTPPAVASLPARLQARLEAWQALVALAAAQARHYNLPALAAQMEALAAGDSARPANPSAAPEASLPNTAAGPTNHVMVYWLRLVRAEAGSVAAIAREQGEAWRPQAARLEALAETVTDLEHRFLSGELAWPVKPSPSP